MNLLQLHSKRCKQHKNTVMVVSDAYILIAKIKKTYQGFFLHTRWGSLAQLMIKSSGMGRSNFHCTGTFTRTHFQFKRYTVLKSENLFFHLYQIEYGAFRLSWCTFEVKATYFSIWFLLQSKMNFNYFITDKSTGIPLSKNSNFVCVRSSCTSSQQFSERNCFMTSLIWLSVSEPHSVSDRLVCSLKLLPNLQYIIHAQNNGLNRS